MPFRPPPVPFASAWARGRFVVVVAAVASLIVPAAAQAPIDLRVALVIGNSAYASAPLANPANDARSMSEALTSMGFVVVDARDASRAEMTRAVQKLRETLRGKHGVGMLYYAGHGLQLDWHNYMVPVDARLAAAADVPGQTVDVQSVLDVFKAAENRMSIVVLDACRDNPFAVTASGKGLAPLDAPPGTFLAYATAPGNVAEDGSAATGNGLYTQFLVQELRAPPAKIEDVFKRVRLQVRRQSEGRQVPWESTSLEEDFYFSAQARPVAEPTWDRALPFEQADWNRIKSSMRADDFYAFLSKYPHGLISEQAQFRLDQLQKVEVLPQTGPDGVRPLASGVDRFAVGDVMRYRLIDGFTQKATEFVSRVTLADRERVELNNGETVLTQMGGVLRNRTGAKNPALLSTPADLVLGKQWRSAFTNTADGQQPSNNFWDSRVVAQEKITVPAGEFVAFRIESQGEARPERGSITFMTRTLWVDPVTMLVLRKDLLFRKDSRITLYDSERLVAFERAPR